MENRKLNQIVFVVMDNYEEKVLGVYNEYKDAVQLAEAAEKDFYDDDVITITPILVDTVNIVPDSRKLYWNEQDVVDALQEEIDLAMPYIEEEEEEEEEVDDFGLPTDYWSEFDEEEVEPLRGSVHDPIAQMLFTYDGKVTISQKNAMEIVRQMSEMIEERGKGLSGEQKTKWLHDALTALAKDYGIEYVLNV